MITTGVLLPPRNEEVLQVSGVGLLSGAKSVMPQWCQVSNADVLKGGVWSVDCGTHLGIV